MPRWAKILLILLLVFAGIGAGGTLLSSVFSGARAELDAAVEPMVRDMADHRWNQSTMLRYASPGLKVHVEDKGISFDPYPLIALGHVTEYVGVQQFEKSSDSAKLVALVKFEFGDARLDLVMSRHKGEWLLDNFNIRYNRAEPEGGAGRNV
ncbi:MAG: hypothetical protein H6883_12700 [Rhodobiaceae bacterium]|nr:hypothetical protein [Rhodobiaceae bacterium]MCC0056983.1 hypothetical protein [Rhodobiaceae bacterium]